MVATSLSLGRLHYFFFFWCLSDLCFLLKCLWLREHFSPDSLLLECDFIGVAVGVFFLSHLLQHRLMCEPAGTLVGSVWESGCALDYLVWYFFFSRLVGKASFTWLVAGFSFAASVLRLLQCLMCALSHCPDGNTSFTHFLHP